MRSKIQKTLLFIPAVCYTLFIFYNSMQSGDASGSLSASIAAWLLRYLNNIGWNISFDTFHFFIRKLAHFTEYFILALIMHKTVSVTLSEKQQIPVSVIWGMIVPLIDEGIQHYTPGRYGSFKDVFLDMTGYFSGLLLVYLFRKYHSRVKRA